MQSITDTYGRTFKTLRVSLLSRCNFGCVYCTMSDDLVTANSFCEPAISSEELLQIVQQLHSVLQFKTIRLTGGEPLLYAGLVQLIRGVKEIGIPEISITTNGFLLERMAMSMKEAGMQSLNVSLDAVDEDIFFAMSKRNKVERVIDGIDAALAAGLKVKINTVVMKGVNDSQIIPLLKFAFERNIPIRFLEVMAMGHLHNDGRKYFFGQQEILHTIAAEYNFSRKARTSSSTSNYWQTDDGKIFGIIANETEPFCHDCNRLRLDSMGNIYGCLSSNNPVSLLGVNNESLLTNKLREALLQKQSLRFVGSELSMMAIGG